MLFRSGIVIHRQGNGHNATYSQATDSTTIEKYDAATNTWTSVDALTFINVESGSLKITKQVDTAGWTNSTAADGTYTFVIKDAAGDPATGKVGDTVITDGIVTITIENGESSTVEVADLPTGTYTVTEVAPENGTTLTSAKVG